MFRRTMKSQMNRKTFLQATLATTLTGLVACSGEGEDPAGGDGDGDMGSGGAGTGGAGTGGSNTGGSNTGGSNTGGSNTGGSNTGGAGTGGDASTGGAATGGDTGSGGAATGGDAGTGGDGTGGEAGGACAAVMAEWVDNHEQGAHAFMMEVSAADVEAGVEKVYNVQGASQHPHTLTVSAQNFADLATNGMVELLTSEDFGHDHTIILTCGM
jgi:hypothetical protein